jgi:hypothetical protein
MSRSIVNQKTATDGGGLDRLEIAEYYAERPPEPDE